MASLNSASKINLRKIHQRYRIGGNDEIGCVLDFVLSIKLSTRTYIYAKLRRQLIYCMRAYCINMKLIISHAIL